MDSDDFSSDESPSQPSRHMPRRAAKLKEPARITRSSAARISQGSASDTQPSSTEMIAVNDNSGGDTEDSPSDDDDDDSGDDFAVPQSGRKRKASQPVTAAAKRPRRTKVTSQPEQSSHAPRRGRRKKTQAPPRQKKSQKNVSSDNGHNDLVLKGDWKNLPYLIWENIFDFVAEPIGDVTARQEDVSIAVLTLCNATKASKVLVEPSLTARYRRVHLKTFGTAQHISATLGIDPDQTAFQIRYRSKIETLRIEVGETLGKKVQGQYVKLWDLVRNLPRLVNFELYHHLDLSYTREHLEANVRWKYPFELFEALGFVSEETGTDGYAKKAATKLKSWTWSSRLAGAFCSLPYLVEIHQTPSFQSLRKLTFLNYQVPSLGTNSGDEAALAMDLPEIQRLAQAICVLPSLEHLAFKSSTMVNGHLLGLLPNTLRHLELHDCYDITAEALRDFLLTHGNKMQRLTLDHCRALNLDFLSVLREACPNLTDLSMDLRYFRYIESYDNDNDPDYDVLLSSDLAPTWPRTLQYLNIQSMRFEGASPIASATTLLKSLTDSASALPCLRHVALRASINVSRRERYKFRETWVPKLESIFKRVSPDPKPTPRRTFIIPIQSVNLNGDNPAPATPARRSTRIAELPSPAPPTPGDIIAAPSQREEKIVRRLKKETKRLRVSNRGYHADNEESEDELSASGVSTPTTPMYRQRLCDVVDIQIDNQKITEHRFTEEDFLDSPKDDEDDEYQD